jgi:hypothetical protein
MVGSTAATNGAVATTGKNHLGWLFLLAIAPAISLLGWINHYAVNVPLGDEWALVPLFEKWNSHQLTFHDLYQQHNEHRIPIPKLIYLAFAHLTNWDLRAEMFFSVALCAATSAGIYALLRRTLGGPPRQILLLWAGANLLIFSPTQAQNWLWGFQLQMFIPNLCLVLTLVTLTSNFPWWPRFGASVFLIAVATFSFGNGLLLWPVVALFLVLRGESKWRIAAWLLVFVLVAALYFPGYYRIPRPHPLTGNWLDYPHYFLVFIGGALSRGREGQLLLGAMVTGAVGLAVYAAISVHFFRTRGEVLRNAAPWLALGPYVIGSAALAAYSRVNWGPIQALDSRYVTNSNYFYLGLIVLAALAMRDIAHSRSRFAGALLAAKRAILITIVTLTLSGFPAGLEDMAILHRQHLAGLGALQFSKAIDTNDVMRRDLRMVPGFVPAPLEYVAALERLHLLQYRRRGSAVLGDARYHPSQMPSEFGQVDEPVRRDPLTLEISGWAILPKSGRPAPVVALAYRDGDQWIGFALCDVREFRDDVAVRLQTRDYRASGWRKTFNRHGVPAQAEEISAWAVDPLANKVHKLAGDYALAE